MAAGALIGGISGAVVVALLGALLLGFLLYRRLKKQDAVAQETGVVSDYNTFKDGMDADEMEASGAPSGSFCPAV